MYYESALAVVVGDDACERSVSYREYVAWYESADESYDSADASPGTSAEAADESAECCVPGGSSELYVRSLSVSYCDVFFWRCDPMVPDPRKSRSTTFSRRSTQINMTRDAFWKGRFRFRLLVVPCLLLS